MKNQIKALLKFWILTGLILAITIDVLSMVALCGPSVFNAYAIAYAVYVLMLGLVSFCFFYGLPTILVGVTLSIIANRMGIAKLYLPVSPALRALLSVFVIFAVAYGVYVFELHNAPPNCAI